MLDIPNYYHDEFNLTSMVSYWCIIENLLKITKPTSVCEIGAERGITSKQLSSYCQDNQISLNIVDPCGIDQDLDNFKVLKIFKERSKDFLCREIPIDFYLIDGDHNYQTVMMELELGVRNKKNKQMPFFMLHDVSWPWAYRDLYFDYIEDGLEVKHSYKTNTALSIDSNELMTIGFPVTKAYAAAIEFGGGHNGVLQAVEDFRKKSGEKQWYFWKIPNLYGLGVLFHKPSLSGINCRKIIRFLNGVEPFRPFLNVLEANRLRALQCLFELQARQKTIEKERDSEHTYIKELENRLAELSNSWQKQQSYISVLEERLDSLTKEHTAASSYIVELEQRLAQQVK
ncbi:hypothetical protein [Salinisphaera sp. G21_0]|uniref:hypothetical protein n=1 Tax=Salinisphaera sp. G21_0 TaxID=2821094 RepID=UPI001AD99AFB|nr:hypothetical protein [Salinisphaera sp. G21_0]